ncbi:hypothetical protein NL676_035686 [Syzygium grande]|nr:hypothetical protein NL676_035686 [Syzygium grande]
MTGGPDRRVHTSRGGLAAEDDLPLSLSLPLSSSPRIGRERGPGFWLGLDSRGAKNPRDSRASPAQMLCC